MKQVFTGDYAESRNDTHSKLMDECRSDVEDGADHHLVVWLKGIKVGDRVKCERGYDLTVIDCDEYTIAAGDLPWYYSRVTGRGIGHYRLSLYSAIFPWTAEDDRKVEEEKAREDAIKRISKMSPADIAKMLH